MAMEGFGSLPILLAVGVCVVAILVQRSRFLWKSPSGARLPEGSYGWPLIGESISFFEDVAVFMASRIEKYGNIFKTNIMGATTIVVTTPESIKMILTDNKNFTEGNPHSIKATVGFRSLTMLGGKQHDLLRRVLQKPLLPESLRFHITAIQKMAVDTMNSWDGKTLKASEEMKDYVFSVALRLIFGLDKADESSKELLKMFAQLGKGVVSFPIDLPSFTFHKSLQARIEGCATLQKLLNERRKEDPDEHRDVLSALLEFQKNFAGTAEQMDDDQVLDMLIGTLFAAHDTTTTMMVWILKHFEDHPEVLTAVVAEQQAIQDSKTSSDDPLTMQDLKKMTYTTQVIQETLRNPTIVDGLFRKALDDVECNEFLIPKGYTVMASTRSLHFNPNIYPDPWSFNPSRFKTTPMPNTFVPFGSGNHVCLGNELNKIEALIFMHHFVLNFRWKHVGPLEPGIVWLTFPLPKDGYPIKVERKL